MYSLLNMNWSGLLTAGSIFALQPHPSHLRLHITNAQLSQTPVHPTPHRTAFIQSVFKTNQQNEAQRRHLPHHPHPLHAHRPHRIHDLLPANTDGSRQLRLECQRHDGSINDYHLAFSPTHGLPPAVGDYDQRMTCIYKRINGVLELNRDCVG